VDHVFPEREFGLAHDKAVRNVDAVEVSDKQQVESGTRDVLEREEQFLVDIHVYTSPLVQEAITKKIGAIGTRY
jgi:hypothetical protein